MSTQSQQLDDHLYGENHREDHVEDVHDGGEELRLLVVLGDEQQQHKTSPSGAKTGLCFCV